MLLQQIEEQKRQKEEEKRRRKQEELEEDDRIRREIELMNAREKGEVDNKKNKQQQYKQMLDEESERRHQPRQQERHTDREPQSNRNASRASSDVPPEFQDLANSVEQQQKKRVNFEQFPSSFPSIPEGQDMFKNFELKGTNTQRLNELQLKFQNEVSGLKNEISSKHHEVISLVSQLKEAQEALKSRESSEKEIVRLKAELKLREQEERSQQAALQNQLLDLMKGYQQQIGLLAKMNEPTGGNFQRPGSNRMIGGNKKDTRSSELKNFEKMLFSGSNQPSKPSNDPSNVIIDFNNPSSKPYVKVSSEQEYNYENYSFPQQRLVDLNKSASLNAESQMVPIGSQSRENTEKRPPKYKPTQYDSPADLGGTNGSIGRRLNKELDEIEKMNNMNAEEFPGSLRGTRTLEQIPEEEPDSLRNSSKFEEFNKPKENSNPNKSLDESASYKLDGTMISDPKLRNGSMKIENFEGFPELPEYEGIQTKYLSTMRSKESDKQVTNPYEDPLEGTAGTVGTGKSIDFDELQKKLTEKTDASGKKIHDAKPVGGGKNERKKWGPSVPNPAPKKQSKLDSLEKEMEGIDQLLEQFKPQDGEPDDMDYLNTSDKDQLPVYETSPDKFTNPYGQKNDRYRPNMESIMEQSNEYTLSKGN